MKYINDLTQEVISENMLYADDVILLDVFRTPALSDNRLNHDLQALGDWAKKWVAIMLFKRGTHFRK